MQGLSYYVIDLETTGLKCSWHEVTEIGIVRCVDRVQLFRQVKCDYPERASLDALEVTKKTMADLACGITKKAAVEECNKFFAEDGLTPAHRVIVGHNIISFDKRFLHALWESVGQEFPAHLWLDTIHLTNEFLRLADHSTLTIKKTATGKISKKLHDACDMVGVRKTKDAHNAKDDSRSTYLLWKKLIEEKNIDHLPFHKTFIHTIKDETANIDDLDLSDVI